MSGIGPVGGAGGVQQIMALRQQIVERSQLLQQIRNPESGTADTSGTTPAGNFTSALQSALEQVSSTQSKAEGLSEAYERGEVTDVAKVMLVRQESGVAFEATLQVRNKLLSAYQDIMRMGI